MLLALGALLLATLACSFDARAPQPAWRYEVPDVWGDSTTDIHVDGARVYMAPKLPPVYDAETLITQAPETHILTALDLNTGRHIWTEQVEIKFATDWLATAGRVIFISPATPGATAQSIVALDGATGQPAWRFDAMQLDDYLLARGECIFIFDTQGSLLCLDAASGQPLGVYPETPASELGELGAEAVQTHITDDAFHRLSPTGILRVYDLPRATLTYSVTLDLAGRPVAMAVDGGHAFVVTAMDEPARVLQVFELPSGMKRWTASDVGTLVKVVEFDGNQYALFKRLEGNLGANSQYSGLVVYDLATGEKLYEVDALGEQYWVSPAGQLVTYPESGRLTAYELVTGKVLWQASSDTDGLAEIAGQADVVYLAGYNTPFMSVSPIYDRFELFNAADGALRWRLNRGVEALIPSDSPAVLLGDAGLLEFYPLAR